MLQPIYLHKEFTEIVAKVSDNLTPQLKEIDANITAVHYQYGHPLEVIKTLGNFDNGVSSKFDKYPLVMFFLDSSVNRTNEIGIYGEQEVNIAIIRACKDPNQTAKERDTFNFEPILTPIYMELMTQISLRGDLFSNIDYPHKMTNRYYWGRSGLFGNDKNIFNDWVDAIEINNLKLKILSTYCPKPAI